MVFLTVGQAFRFGLYDKLVEVIPMDQDNQDGVSFKRTMVASCISSVLLTTLLYPFDLCHTKMSADMTKKQSVYNQKYKNKNL